MADLTVAVYRADMGGCGHYRAVWPAAAAGQQTGITVHETDAPRLNAHWTHHWTNPTGDDYPPDGHPARLVAVDPPDVDVAVIQRPLRRHVADLIPALQAHGVAVVVEVDDDFQTIDRRNMAWPHVQPHLNADRNWKHLARACQQADLVTVSTPALAARYGAHGRVRVLRNCVPASYLTCRPGKAAQLTVGWPGSVQTHPGDLEVVGSGLAQALERTGARFRCVGSEHAARTLGVPPVRAEAFPWVELDLYPEQVAQFTVGIAPLADTVFNRSKSWLKPLEMAALGVPVVMSDLPEYTLLSTGYGLGATARKPRHWEGLVGLLLTDESQRQAVIKAGESVAASLTYERNGWRWAEAWADAAIVAAGRRLAA